MKLYLVRHGESDANVLSINSHPTKTKLTEKGHEQAQKVADALKDVSFDVAFISTNTRARQTAIPFFLTHVCPFFFEHDLGEHNPGVHTLQPHGSLKQAAKEAEIDFREYLPKDGESIMQFHERVVKAINRIKKDNHEKKVLCVTHGGVIATILIELLGIPKDMEEYHTKNCSITTIDFSTTPPSVDFNRVDHLEE